MRVVSLLVVISSFSVVWAQEAKKDNSPQEQPKIPTTLAEAHAALERIFSREELAKIDAMPSEDGMIQYHMPFGTGLRNSWGLWRDSPLAKYMRGLGFTHPDAMSSVILVTFWRKRHGQDLRLEELAAAARESKSLFQKIREKEDMRIQKTQKTIRNMVVMAFLSIVFLAGGLACLVVSKIPVYRQGIWLSADATLYKVAYVVMSMGALLMLFLLGALRLQA